MKKFEIMNNLSRTFKTTGLKVKKHSPEILVVTGVVGVVVSAVMACKATTKAGDIIDEMHIRMSAIESVANSEEIEDYTEEDKKKDTVIVYSQTAMKLGGLYAPSVLLGTASIACILFSHNILHKRNVAIAAAYAMEHANFKEYRNRLVERFGKELDKELRYNVKAVEVEEIVTDEKGKEKVVKKTVNVANPIPSEYAKCFDEYCTGWSRDPEFNLMYLHRQQDYANELLKANGYLFLNEVHDMLGIPRTKYGQIVGWIYDESGKSGGDNYVDFGIYDIHKEANRDFVNGRECSIWLDFNVDGNILDLI